MANDLVVLERQLAPLAPRFAQVLGRTMPAERLIRTVMVSCERLPKLFECDRQSLFNAAMSAACLGLEVDGVTGQAYLIPFKGKAQLVIGYKGYNTIAARSGITITGEVVREGDEFDYQFGTAAYVRHRPATGKNRRITHAWACAQTLERPAVIAVMDIDELMAVKAKSPGGARSDSPWNDPAIGFPAMCSKTVKRRLARSLPLNVMHLADRLDAAVDHGQAAWISPDKGLVVEGVLREDLSILPASRHDTRTPTAAELIDPPASPSPPRGEGGDEGSGNTRTSIAPSAPDPSLRPQDEAADEPMDNSRARYIEATRNHIRKAVDYEVLGTWWNSEEQKQARRDFELSNQDIEELKAFLIARRDQLKARQGMMRHPTADNGVGS